MTTPIRVVLVDDHALLRGSLEAYLNGQPDIDVVGTAAEARAGIAEARTHNPDVIVMDIDMPGMKCFQAVKQIRKFCENAKVIFLSAFTSDRYIDQALSSHALGYVTKEEPKEVLVEAIRKAMKDMAYFSQSVRDRLIIDDEHGARLSPQAGVKSNLLTDREVEVLGYIAKGHSKKEIAQIMFRSTSTVDKHTENLMAKLDIHNRVELTRFAIREGLAEP